jgi:ketosteroid isomerase-like protein
VPEESTTPDLVEVVRRSLEASSRRDLDAAFSIWAPDALVELAPLGFGVLKGGSLTGREAIRKFWEDLLGAFDGFEIRNEELHDFGSGVTFAVFRQRGRPHGGGGFVENRYGAVGIWRDGRIARSTTYLDIDEGRAAAERLAEERG